MSGKTIASVLQNVILPVVTVGTATMVAWLNYSVSRVDQGLKEQIAAVDIAIKEARDEREKINAEREFNFRIYDLVLNSLEEGNQQKQEVAKQFVLVMVDGELRKRLLGVLEEGGTEEIKRETAQVLAQERVYESGQMDVLRTARTTTPSFNWEDWDYDIFWCSESGEGAQQQAVLIQDQLLKEGAAGRIRVRELPASINAKTGYKISGYVIRRGESETSQARALQTLSEQVLADNGFPAAFQQQLSLQQTKWYISAFVCP
ncbi:MAG: hypothetical protein ACPGZU_08075 [Ketobacter sp.]|uniref:hypothetical protein n=1 Tax=unclassified Ketobacter TaxID=2639109 RepID=UPI0025C0B5AD|nr:MULTISPECIES: hypothetical protein [unclassified Ketobacter]